MTEFTFEALALDGSIETGRHAARTEDELAAYLRDRGKYLVTSRRADPIVVRSGNRRVDVKVRTEDLLAFTDHIAGSLQVGIPLLAALQDTQQRIRSQALRRVVQDVSASMSEHGMQFSDALRQHPKAFSQLYVGTVSAGEASGHLDYALRQLADYMDWQRDISVQIRQALLYPAIVVSLVTALMAVLLTFVYPRILPVLTSLNVELPLLTVVLTSIATFLREQWLLLSGGLLAAIAALLLARRTQRGRYRLDALALRLPVFGPLVHHINMARVVTYFALFYRTGVELVLSLTLVEQMMPNRRVARAVAHVRERLVEGQTMTAAFASEPVFPPELVRSIALGEATGAMDESLNRVRAHYAREVPAAVKRMLTALQPLLVVALGGMILLVALSMVLPMVSIYDNLGRLR